MLYKSSIVSALRMSSPLISTPYSSSAIAITDKAHKEFHASRSLNTVDEVTSSENSSSKIFITQLSHDAKL